jgi:type II secretory ATPase GspE/PulE/Tfp pilus assembly ATPase PilB-like protein
VLAGWLELYGGNPALSEARGCAECRASGYRGRLGLFELLTVTPALRQMMLARASDADLEHAAIAAGMRTMKQDGIGKCLGGLTDLTQVHAAAM